MGEYHKQKGHGRISIAKRSWVNITSKKVMGEYHKQKGHGRISRQMGHGRKLTQQVGHGTIYKIKQNKTYLPDVQ